MIFYTIAAFQTDRRGRKAIKAAVPGIVLKPVRKRASKLQVTMYTALDTEIIGAMDTEIIDCNEESHLTSWRS